MHSFSLLLKCLNKPSIFVIMKIEDSLVCVCKYNNVIYFINSDAGFEILGEGPFLQFRWLLDDLLQIEA
jgi:hypothetical protein